MTNHPHRSSRRAASPEPQGIPITWAPVPPHAWLWPDHAIGKRESRRLREEHNALVNEAVERLEALEKAVAWWHTDVRRMGQREPEWLIDARAALAKARGDA